nr:hypothetical protein [Desulfosediminicola ganghwensis]
MAVLIIIAFCGEISFRQLHPGEGRVGRVNTTVQHCHPDTFAGAGCLKSSHGTESQGDAAAFSFSRRPDPDQGDHFYWHGHSQRTGSGISPYVITLFQGGFWLKMFDVIGGSADTPIVAAQRPRCSRVGPMILLVRRMTEMVRFFHMYCQCVVRYQGCGSIPGEACFESTLMFEDDKLL